MLNLIWIFFFISAFFIALWEFMGTGQGDVFVRIMSSIFEMSAVAFKISIGLVGVMAFWMGMMRVAERGGFLKVLTRLAQPFLKKIFPEVPENHPAFGSIIMNMASNMLGLDNAATPLGLKAMKELQTLNPDPEKASNAQILFLVLNTSSVTLFPVTIFAYRAQQGAADPTDVFIPILIATFVSTLVGLIAVATLQGIWLLDKVVSLYLGGMILGIGGVIYYFSQLDPETMRSQSAVLSNFLLFSVITGFLANAAWKRLNVYEIFVDGAKDGFKIAVTIIPYLVAMLVAVGVFRASGAMDIILNGIRNLINLLGWDSRFVDAVPTALMKPLSGSGARGMMVETMQNFGADSFAGRLASIVQGSTETTFYVLALYFGSVGIRRTRHAIPCGLLADFGGILTAILICYMFFGGERL